MGQACSTRDSIFSQTAPQLLLLPQAAVALLTTALSLMCGMDLCTQIGHSSTAIQLTSRTTPRAVLDTAPQSTAVCHTGGTDNPHKALWPAQRPHLHYLSGLTSLWTGEERGIRPWGHTSPMHDKMMVFLLNDGTARYKEVKAKNTLFVDQTPTTF